MNNLEFQFQNALEKKEYMIIDLNATFDDYEDKFHINLKDEVKITKADILSEIFLNFE